jgi:hypothetical protein
MGGELNDLRDTRKGKTHLPHPLWSRLTKLMPMRKRDPQLDDVDWWSDPEAKWSPRSLGKLFYPGKDISSLRQLCGVTEQQFDNVIKTHNIYHSQATITAEDVQYVACVNSVHHSADGRSLIVRAGDDVKIIYDEKDAWCLVQFIIAIVVERKGYVYVQPRWYDHPRKTRRKPMKHKIRKTQLLEGASVEEGKISPFVPCKDVVGQVLVVHSCERTGTKCCSVADFCKEHNHKDCEDGFCTLRGQSGYYRKVHHHEGNMLYEVIDRSLGFTPGQPTRSR